MLTGKERRELRGEAHGKRANIMYGKDGLSEGFLKAIESEFINNKVIKIKFIAEKEKKKDISNEIAKRLKCQSLGLIGNNSIFYRS